MSNDGAWGDDMSDLDRETDSAVKPIRFFVSGNRLFIELGRMTLDPKIGNPYAREIVDSVNALIGGKS